MMATICDGSFQKRSTDSVPLMSWRNKQMTQIPPSLNHDDARQRTVAHGFEMHRAFRRLMPLREIAIDVANEKVLFRWSSVH